MSHSKRKPSDTKLLTVVVLATPPLYPYRVGKFISRRIEKPSAQSTLSTLDKVRDVVEESMLNNARHRGKDGIAAASAFEEWWRGVEVWQGEGLLFAQATSESNVSKCYILPKGTTCHDASLVIRSKMGECKSKNKKRRRSRDANCEPPKKQTPQDE